jgi:transcriptional regulator with XRE-family HTH domain
MLRGDPAAGDDLQSPKRATVKRRTDAVDALVGRCIRVHRMTLGMSQGQLANQLGVTFQQVQKYEKGINRIGASRLMRIAEIFEVPVQSLFGDLPSKRNPSATEPTITDWLTDPGAMRLIQAYRRVREPQLQRAIIDFVEGMAPKP